MHFTNCSKKQKNRNLKKDLPFFNKKMIKTKFAANIKRKKNEWCQKSCLKVYQYQKLLKFYGSIVTHFFQLKIIYTCTYAHVIIFYMRWSIQKTYKLFDGGATLDTLLLLGELFTGFLHFHWKKENFMTLLTGYILNLELNIQKSARVNATTLGKARFCKLVFFSENWFSLCDF